MTGEGWGRYRSVCPEGHHDCLRRVSPEAIVAAALELLATPRGALTGEPAPVGAGAAAGTPPLAA